MKRLLLFTLVSVPLLSVTSWASAQTLTRPPEIARFVEAEYPPSALEAREEASVLVELTIDAAGRVTEAIVVTSGGEAFDAAALEAVRQFEFVPAEFDGVPGPIRIQYQYNFTLPKPVSSVLAGVVREEKTGEPLPGVTVEVEGRASAVTDEEGRFELGGLDAGEWEIRLSSPSLGTIQTVETLAGGERLEVVYDLAPPPPLDEGDDMEIVVMAPVVRRQVAATRVSAEQASLVPGTAGDVVRVVESLPGVARAALGTGQLVVWGAAPEDTRIYIDYVPIPRLYHEGGLRSIVNPEYVESIELIPGGAGAAFGRGLGGVVLIDSTGPTRQGLHGTVGVDLIDAKASLGHRDEKGNYQAAAARYGILDQFAGVMGEDAQELVPIPSFWDGQARAGFKLKSGAMLDVVGLVSGDRYSRGVPNPDPALATNDTRELDVTRLYARYRRQSSDGTTVDIVPYVGYDRSLKATSFGSLTSSVAVDSVVLGLRAGYGKRVTPWMTLRAGADIELVFDSHDRSGSIGFPPREGDRRVFGQAPPDTISSDRYQTREFGVAPLVEATFTAWHQRLQITPGLRFDPYARYVSRTFPANGRIPAQGAFVQGFAVEPRLAVTLETTKWLSLRGSVGRYYRLPESEDLSAAFGNPTLPVARALQTVGGFAARIIEQLELEVDGFYTRSDQLAMRSLDPTPAIARALDPVGEGRVYGVQALLRASVDPGVFGWGAYTFSHAERKNGPDEDWRLFDYDQPHVLTVVAGWTATFGLELSGRFRYASGMPRTEVIGSYYDASRDLWQPIFGAYNGIRLPAFIQLDLRVAYSRKLRGDDAFMVYLDLLNVSNRRNVEEYIYSPDYSERQAIYGLPILPVLGVQWSY